MNTSSIGLMVHYVVQHHLNSPDLLVILVFEVSAIKLSASIILVLAKVNIISSLRIID